MVGRNEVTAGAERPFRTAVKVDALPGPNVIAAEEAATRNDLVLRDRIGRTGRGFRFFRRRGMASAASDGGSAS